MQKNAKCASCTNRQNLTKKTRQGFERSIKSYPQFRVQKARKTELYTKLFTLSTKNVFFLEDLKLIKTNNCFVKKL